MSSGDAMYNYPRDPTCPRTLAYFAKPPKIKGLR